VTAARVTAARVTAGRVTAARVTAARVTAARVTAARVTAARVTAARVTAARVTAARVTAARVMAARVTAARVTAARDRQRWIAYRLAVPELELNVGCRAADAIDAQLNQRVPLLLLYPTQAPARPERLGPYTLPLAMDAPPAGERLPLVALSHGTGSSPLLFRNLALYLARAGFVVALPTHPGNHRDDNHLADALENWVNRPRHLRLAVDAAFADARLGPRLVPGAVALIGHSLGGYTALALAGGRPTALPRQAADGVARPIPVERDRRVRALVLLAPATVWFALDGALADVDVPIFMRSAEHDDAAPAMHGDIVLRGVPDARRVDHRVIAGANHFAFLTPFPPERVRPDFPPSQDRPGFDRLAMQRLLEPEIAAFLRPPQHA
jgi:predicted dienelactone hydrolase